MTDTPPTSMTADEAGSGDAGGVARATSERYVAFISYRHTDPDRYWAKWLHSRIETYRVPKTLRHSGLPARPGRVFRDEEELPASADLSARIDEALTNARFLIVVCSRNTPESRWVNEEVTRFRDAGRGDRILALLVDGEPAQSFPHALRDAEPLAADVRPVEGETRRAIRKSASLKLLAGVLGVQYDELRRRDEQRTRQRLSRIAAGASLISLLLLGLSIFAWLQWRRAEHELRVQRAQSLAAQSQIAYVTTPVSEAYALSSPERGVLLALESLEAFPTIEGDVALRNGMRLLDGDPLDVPIDESDVLLSVGDGGRSVRLITPDGPRTFDIATRSYSDSGPPDASPASVIGTDVAAAAASDEDASDVLARSADGSLELVASDMTRCSGAGKWIFACTSVRSAADQTAFADLPHDWFVKFAAFSPDARWLVTVTGEASTDAQDPAATLLVGSTIHVWELSSGREASRIHLAHDGGIDQTALSPDGDWLATTSRTTDGKVVRLWPLWPAVARAEACRRLPRNLSPSEWQTFMGTMPQRPTCPGLPIISE